MRPKDLSVWKSEDCAWYLSTTKRDVRGHSVETSADMVELNVRLLAKTAKAFGMPIVLSTVGVDWLQRAHLPSVLSELDGIEPIDRSSMNAFEDAAFSEAVKATGRKRLIIGGSTIEICLHLLCCGAQEG